MEVVHSLRIFQYKYISVLKALAQTPISVSAKNVADQKGWSLQCMLTANNVALQFHQSQANSTVQLKWLRFDTIDTIVLRERIRGYLIDSYLSNLQVKDVLLNVLLIKWFVVMKAVNAASTDVTAFRLNICRLIWLFFSSLYANSWKRNDHKEREEQTKKQT